MTYPTDRLEPRPIENLPGEMYDPAKTKQLFAEDIIQITDDVRAIEDDLLDNPPVRKTGETGVVDLVGAVLVAPTIQNDESGNGMTLNLGSEQINGATEVQEGQGSLNRIDLSGANLKLMSKFSPNGNMVEIDTSALETGNSVLTVPDKSGVIALLDDVGGGGMENPLTVDLDFDGYKAIALACDNGATLPATAVIGQWFLHTPTGRKVLFQYNGTSWTPICSLGAMTIYVSTTGTDDQEHGTGTGTDAFATIAYAYTQIPGTLNGNVAINLGAGSYSGVSTLRGKVFTDNYAISINGDYLVGADQTISARTNASSAVYGQITVSGAGWTTNEHKGKIIVFTKLGGVTPGTLTYRVVKSNTSDTLTLLGIAVTGLAVNDTFGFVTHNTIFLNNQVYYQENVITNFLKYDVGTAYGANLGSNVTMNACRIESTYNIFLDTVFKMAVLNHCSLQMEGASGTHAIETQSTSAVRLSGTFIYHSGSTTNNAGVHVTAGTFLVFRDNSLIQGGATTKFNSGILIEGGGIVDHRIGSFIEDCVAGVKCNNNGTDFSSLGPGTAFANNTQNYVAVPGLYSSTGTPRGAHIVEGSATLVNGTVQVTMSGAAAAFSSTTSYTVLVSSTLNDRTLKVVNDSVTQFTITSSDLTDTDVVRYVVIGS